MPRLVILGIGPLAGALDGLLGLLGWSAIPCATGEEATALVSGLTTADGLPFDPFRPDLLATNGKFHAELLGVLNGNG